MGRHAVYNLQHRAALILAVVLLLPSAAPAHAQSWAAGQAIADVRAECSHGITPECRRKALARLLCPKCNNWKDAEAMVDYQTTMPERVAGIRQVENASIQLETIIRSRPLRLPPHPRHVPQGVDRFGMPNGKPFSPLPQPIVGTK